MPYRGIATLLFLVVPSRATLAQTQSLSASSAIRAKAVIDAAVAAMGGAVALQQVADVTRELGGVRTDVGQGPKPLTIAATYSELGPIPPTVNDLRITSIRDYANRRSVEEIRAAIYGGQRIDSKSVVAAPAPFAVWYDHMDRGIRMGDASQLTNSLASAFRRYPEGLIRAAQNRPESLRWLGDGMFDGRKQDVIAFVDIDGSNTSLFFDNASHLLTKTERVTDDAVLGDAVNETVYLDYRTTNGVQLPWRYVDRSGGFVVQDLRATAMTVNTRPNDTLFVRPAGIEEFPPIADSKPERVGDRVLLVLAAYNSIAVAFNDHVLVLEAGGNNRLTQNMVTQVKTTFPGKPIRYVVVSHWNYDHIAGIRSYIAEGSTIVATPMARIAIDRAAASIHTLRPDVLSRAPRPPAYEIVTAGKRTFTDGVATVELYSLSPNPHVDEMLFAYLPNEKILFEADLFDIDVSGKPRAGGRNSVELLNRISALKLDVTKIIPVHGVPATMEDLRQAVAKMARQ